MKKKTETQSFKERNLEMLKELNQDDLYFYALQWLQHVHVTQEIHKKWHLEEAEEGENQEEESTIPSQEVV